MSKSDNTIKRIVMTVDQFYKHDEQDEQYAYGFDMSTNEPVRIRMSSLKNSRRSLINSTSIILRMFQ